MIVFRPAIAGLVPTTIPLVFVVDDMPTVTAHLSKDAAMEAAKKFNSSRLYGPFYPFPEKDAASESFSIFVEWAIKKNMQIVSVNDLVRPTRIVVVETIEVE